MYNRATCPSHALRRFVTSCEGEMKRLTVPILVVIAALASACSGSSQTDLAATAADGGGAPESALNSYPGVTPVALDGAAKSPAAAVPAASGPGAPAAAPALAGGAYRIGPFDVLEIQVFKVPELSKTVQVSEAGTINYPLIGEVSAAGRSAR
jgi:polysaccharide export outer membrane protein